MTWRWWPWTRGEATDGWVTSAGRAVLTGEPVALARRELASQVGATPSGPIRALCVGPQEWPIVSDEYPASDLRERIEPDLPKQPKDARAHALRNFRRLLNAPIRRPDSSRTWREAIATICMRGIADAPLNLETP